jgi:hypothetical protein
LVFFGCSGAAPSNPEALREEREQIRTDLLLNQAELVRAELLESESRQGDHGPRLIALQKQAERRLKALTEKCRVGDGLESCSKLDDLEKIYQVVSGRP